MYRQCTLFIVGQHLVMYHHYFQWVISVSPVSTVGEKCITSIYSGLEVYRKYLRVYPLERAVTAAGLVDVSHI